MARAKIGDSNYTMDDSDLLVVGPSLIQNQLLANFIAKQMGLDVQVCATDTWLKQDAANQSTLVLYDCLDMDSKTLRQFIGKEIGWTRTVALFNVEPTHSDDKDHDLEVTALSSGFKGIFKSSATPETLVRGIETILEGILWYSRSTFSTFFQHRRAPLCPQDDSTLTAREKEVLELVYMGATNDMVASKLFISPNTVKTHIYRIYKKIGVTSRFQAVHWASRHASLSSNEKA
jgi:DNA-binding NarL/FixJ family response regulator